jgi:hypothetical protein
VLLVALGIGLLAAAALAGVTMRPQLESLFRPPTLLEAMDVFPNDTIAVIGVNMKRLAESPMITRYEQQLRGIKSDSLRALSIDGATIESGGINILRDAKALILALVPGDAESPWYGVAVALGEFNSNQIERELRAGGWQELEYAGRDYYRRGDEAVTILDDHRVAMGDAPSVLRVLDVDAGRAETVKANYAVTESLGDIRDQDMFWLIYTESEPTLATINLIGQVMPLLTDIGWDAISGGAKIFNFDEQVETRVTVLCANESQAETANTALNSLLMIGKFAGTFARQQPGFSATDDQFAREMINSMHVSREKEKLRLNCRVSAETAAAVLNQHARKATSNINPN